MKYSLLLPLIFFLACFSKDPLQGPVTSEIKKGGKWTLRIGSSPEEVYAQLQALGLEKGFDRVAVVGRTAVATPAELPADLATYDALTLQTTDGRLERIQFEFSGDTVSGVFAGGGRLDSVGRWPAGDVAIDRGDAVADVRDELTVILGRPEYAGYELVLPDKPLPRAYDPGMAELSEWRFVFFEDRDPPYQDRYTVRLLFEGDRLRSLQVTQQRFELVN